MNTVKNTQSVNNDTTNTEMILSKYDGKFSDETMSKVKALSTKKNVEVVMDNNPKVSIVNDKFEKFKDSITPYIDENKEIMNQMYSKVVRMTYNFIQIGKILTDAKKELSGDDFKKLISQFDIDERMSYRYIRLVKDDRVSELDIEELTSMLKPSMSKLLSMKKLNDTDFHKVLCGDDTPLIGEKKEEEEWVKNNIFSHQIDDKTYYNLLKSTKIEIMKYFVDIIDEMKNDNEELIDMVKVITESKVYQSDKEAA